MAASNYPFVPKRNASGRVTWDEMQRTMDKPQLKRCPEEVKTQQLFNTHTRLTTSAWLNAPWKTGMQMRRVALYVEKISHEKIMFERPDGKMKESLVTNVIVTNMNENEEVILEIIAWEDNAVRLQALIQKGNVSQIEITV